jgi:hypothetical protein
MGSFVLDWPWAVLSMCGLAIECDDRVVNMGLLWAWLAIVCAGHGLGLPWGGLAMGWDAHGLVWPCDGLGWTLAGPEMGLLGLGRYWPESLVCPRTGLLWTGLSSSWLRWPCCVLGLCFPGDGPCCT